jgi:putative transposase
MVELTPIPVRELSTAALETGQRRFAAFERLIPAGEPVSSAVVDELCEETGLKPRMVRELARRFQLDRRAETLAPRRRGPKAGVFRHETEVQEAILKLARDIYLVRVPPAVDEAARQIWAAMKAPSTDHKFQPHDVPSVTTVARILKRISKRTVARHSLGSKTRTAYEPHPGEYLSEGCLDLVQMDHTRADVYLLDRVHRQPLGRPWITFLIDVFTRCILGFYVSHRDPSIYRCGRAVANAILPKEPLLEQMGLDIGYPMHGVFKRLHADQAASHRNEGFRRACMRCGIDPDVRKPGPAHHGGHIERLIGTMMGKLRLLPGSTASNVTKRDGYDVEAAAVMTLPEFEKWLLMQIAIYHHSPHRGLYGRTPAHAWAIAAPPNPLLRGPNLDPEELVIAFLQRVDRTVSSSGIHVSHRRYWHPVLAGRLGQTISIHRDGADIRHIYAEIDGRFVELRSHNESYPQISEWEWEAARKQYRKENKKFYGDGGVAELAVLMRQSRELVEKASYATRAMRIRRKRSEAEGVSHGDQSLKNEVHAPEPSLWKPVSELSLNRKEVKYYEK